MLPKVAVVLSVLLVLAGSVSCDGNFCIAVVTLTPQSATANASAPPPGNTVIFFATSSSQGMGCPLGPATPVVVGNVDASWTSSDMTNVSIVNQKTQIGTNGLATCLSPTPVPAIITATSPDGKRSTSTLDCR